MHMEIGVFNRIDDFPFYKGFLLIEMEFTDGYENKSCGSHQKEKNKKREFFFHTPSYTLKQYENKVKIGLFHNGACYLSNHRVYYILGILQSSPSPEFRKRKITEIHRLEVISLTTTFQDQTLTCRD